MVVLKVQVKAVIIGSVMTNMTVAEEVVTIVEEVLIAVMIAAHALGRWSSLHKGRK